MTKKKICVVTGNRAEYGLFFPIMKKIQSSDFLDLQVVATTMHFSEEFGNTYKKIEKDGFFIHEKIENLLSSDSKTSIAKSSGFPKRVMDISIAKEVINRMVNVSDKNMIDAMKYSFEYLKLFLEPACAAGFAALKSNIKKEFKGQNTLILLCGSNIDYKSWNKLVKN